MEQESTILIADLTGYTSLTETHGSFAAADLIDIYDNIVQRSLKPKTRLVERVGDQVMIISQHAEDLVETALMLLKYSSIENKFLQIHGGLHNGKILTRNQRLFGSAINIAARLAAKATPGSFWCSEEFFETVAHHPAINHKPKGKQHFKNLHEEMTIIEITHRDSDLIVTDPVCKMLLNDQSSSVRHPERNDVWFCSEDCLDTFLKIKSSNSFYI